MKWHLLVGFLAVCFLFPFSATAAEYFVSPTGTSNGDGSIRAPWDLQTALDQPTAVKPGDTIFLRGGSYTNAYSCYLKGTSSAPIIVKAYQDERVILDAERNNLIIRDSWYVWFWGLEVTYSHNPRDAYAPQTGNAIVAVRDTPTSHDIKFINMIVHDTKQSGYGWYESNYDSEIYGNLIYYAGTKTLDHGIYVHNQTGHKWITDTIIGDTAGYGIHGYGGFAGDGTPMYIDGIVGTGNIIYKAGSIGCKESTTTCGAAKSSILIGGLSGQYAENPELHYNATYTTSSSGGSLNLGYSGGSRNAVVANNTFMGGMFVIGGSYSGLSLHDNTIYYTSISGIQPTSYPNNNWTLTKPTNTQVVVRPNTYDQNRAHIAIYNWSKAATVTLSLTDLASLNLKAGDTYTLRNAQDYFNDQITGTVAVSGIQVPMNGHTVAQPIGVATKPATTFPEFGAFVLSITRNQASPLPTGIKPGDANQDGLVNGIDYMVWRNHYNQTVSGSTNGDFDNSGKVDGVDYIIWRNNYLQ